MLRNLSSFRLKSCRRKLDLFDRNAFRLNPNMLNSMAKKRNSAFYSVWNERSLQNLRSQLDKSRDLTSDLDSLVKKMNENAKTVLSMGENEAKIVRDIGMMMTQGQISEMIAKISDDFVRLSMGSASFVLEMLVDRIAIPSSAETIREAVKGKLASLLLNEKSIKVGQAILRKNSFHSSSFLLDEFDSEARKSIVVNGPALGILYSLFKSFPSLRVPFVEDLLESSLGRDWLNSKINVDKPNKIVTDSFFKYLSEHPASKWIENVAKIGDSFVMKLFELNGAEMKELTRNCIEGKVVELSKSKVHQRFILNCLTSKEDLELFYSLFRNELRGNVLELYQDPNGKDIILQIYTMGGKSFVNNDIAETDMNVLSNSPEREYIMKRLKAFIKSDDNYDKLVEKTMRDFDGLMENSIGNQWFNLIFSKEQFNKLNPLFKRLTYYEKGFTHILKPEMDHYDEVMNRMLAPMLESLSSATLSKPKEVELIMKFIDANDERSERMIEKLASLDSLMLNDPVGNKFFWNLMEKLNSDESKHNLLNRLIRVVEGKVATLFRDQKKGRELIYHILKKLSPSLDKSFIIKEVYQDKNKYINDKNDHKLLLDLLEYTDETSLMAVAQIIAKELYGLSIKEISSGVVRKVLHKLKLPQEKLVFSVYFKDYCVELGLEKHGNAVVKDMFEILLPEQIQLYFKKISSEEQFIQLIENEHGISLLHYSLTKATPEQREMIAPLLEKYKGKIN
eukprot:TRINITY_DN3033_c0_g1_i1.p1 TRINITY_DN3033_c0_g1~~TRINITY_DN3033_c0_g1_i1.p1  ORF type:complete len:736 (-),score=301.32 TRINITY_DN3033_c0_g1_i1:5-2212(-)